MFFLLRMAFWLGIVLVLLPTGSAQRPAGAEISASEALSAASATVGDLRGFCTREPSACSVGSQMATAIGYKAQAGAKMLYDVLTQAMAPHDGAPLATGTTRRGGPAKAAPDRPSSPRESRNTLTPTDLAPAWRGPQPRRGAKHAA
jgi:Family of unknown function (DUF5330)